MIDLTKTMYGDGKVLDFKMTMKGDLTNTSRLQLSQINVFFAFGPQLSIEQTLIGFLSFMNTFKCSILYENFLFDFVM